MKKFKSIIFDCDGVLIDSEIIANEIGVEIKNELGFPITIDEQLNTYVGLGISHPTIQAELKRLPANYQTILEERLHIAYRERLRPIKEVVETLNKINVPICVASSSEPDSLAFKLKLTKLDTFFKNATFDGRMVQHCKPAPDLYLLALKKMGWQASDTLVIEDSVAGVTAAKAAHLTTLGFTGGGHIRPGHEQKLIAAGADRVFSDFKEVAAIFL